MVTGVGVPTGEVVMANVAVFWPLTRTDEGTLAVAGSLLVSMTDAPGGTGTSLKVTWLFAMVPPPPAFVAPRVNVVRTIGFTVRVAVAEAPP